MIFKHLTGKTDNSFKSRYTVLQADVEVSIGHSGILFIGEDFPIRFNLDKPDLYRLNYTWHQNPKKLITSFNNSGDMFAKLEWTENPRLDRLNGYEIGTTEEILLLTALEIELFKKISSKKYIEYKGNIDERGISYDEHE